jgi:N-acetylmuramoyl-L-alanine amidase
LTTSRKYAAVLLAALAGAAVAAFSVHAQPEGQIPRPATQSPPAASTMNHNLVVLDPAHGGSDPGGTLDDHVLEKDVTLAMAARLRTALTAAGFTVISTRDADAGDPLTADQRADIANHAHAVACIVLHATAIGSGVHVYTSMLSPAAPDQNPDDQPPSAFIPVPWDMAQAASVDQSLRLANDLRTALGAQNLPVVVGHAPLKPLDNLMCPAVAIELSPLAVAGVGPTPVTDANYQQSLVSTVTTALRTWRTHADPPSTAETAPDPDPEAQAAVQARAIAAANAAGLAAARASVRNQTPAAAPLEKVPQ